MNKIIDKVYGIIFLLVTLVIAFGVFIEGFLNMKSGYIFAIAGIVGYVILFIWGTLLLNKSKRR